MAQAQVDEIQTLPDHEFMVWHKRESLFIDGHCLIFNKKHVKKNGEESSYFYCCQKIRLGCRKSARAMQGEDGAYILVSYTGQHSTDCIPNSAYLAVRKVRTEIKRRVLEDPTLKPSTVYISEVNRVRDHLGK